MIASTGNSQVKNVLALAKKAKARREQGSFIVEGIKMFKELPKEQLEKVYLSQHFLKQARQNKNMIEELLTGCEWEEVSDEVMNHMSETQTPQGILAVVRQFSYSLEEILKKEGPAHLMILETLQDPGNLGTIIRAGEGAGVTGVIMNSKTADIYNPKVIRSTMGSIYRVPFVYIDNLKEAVDSIKKAGISLFAAHLNGNISYEEASYRDSVGFLIGNEANGLTEETASLADRYVKIPMAGQVESLNAAIAASILMFEAARQRREKTKE